jgi:hypothetical protein|tara:strand:+ start:1732 stop:2865 length:1134 start_codon:yes stop_codon:yes gene_type:complete
MYQVLAGKKRSLVFPVMCNGFVKLDYSDNVVDTNNDGDTSNDIAYGLFDHEGSFTFEAIVTPYDINGYGRQSASGTIPSFTLSKKIMPSNSHQSTTANYQSELYLPVSGGRLTHEMRIFSNDKFSVSLLNATSFNENQPAEYKIRVSMDIGGTTETFTTTSAVITANKSSMFKWSSTSDTEGFDSNGRRTFDLLGSTTSHSGAVIGLSGTVENQCHASQELFIRDGFTFTSIGTIASVTGTTSVTLSASYSPTLSNGTKVFIHSRKEASYINNTYHIACTYTQSSNRINIFLNGINVLSTKHTQSGTFAFGRTDSFIGANGTGATGTLSAITNKQFMGEMHEMSILNIPKTTFVNKENLLPSLNNTLLYLRFEEIDL